MQSCRHAASSVAGHMLHQIITSSDSLILMLSPPPATLLQVLHCQKPSAGFGGSPRHDPHILYTLSAVQILALYNKTDLLDADAVAACELGVLQALPACQCCACAPGMATQRSGACSYQGVSCTARHVVYVRSLPALSLCRVIHADIAQLQQPDGSFTGDEWGEVDTRCVCNCLLADICGSFSLSSLQTMVWASHGTRSAFKDALHFMVLCSVCHLDAAVCCG